VPPRVSIIDRSDTYKVGHHLQYPPDTQNIYSYMESRGGMFEETVFFGLQYYLLEYLEGVRVTMADIDRAEVLFRAHILGRPSFNRAGWEHIVKHWGGKLPIRIKAVPEGLVLPYRNVLMTMETPDPKCYWLVNYLETLLSKIWYTTTVATSSREIRKILLHFLEMTGDPSQIDYKLHDFGYRGVSSEETAALGGMAHLTSFMGTDTIIALIYAMEYYNTTECPGHSINASEHSTMTSWGREHEVDAMRNMLTQYPEGPVACVSDQYDIMYACREHWGTTLKDAVMNRDGTLVVRPDSGDPESVVANVAEILWDKFGGDWNSKGYRVLDPHVRIIQGDGIKWDHSRHTIEGILGRLALNKFSADNIAFGSGGGLLQKWDRDTQEFAIKCSAILRDGTEYDVYKEPVGMPQKNSKRGRLALVKTEQGIQTVNAQFAEKHGVSMDDDILEVVFENGKVINPHTWEEVKARSLVA
jgi:nicotinamide phosphoribosyltransferase